MKTTKEAFREVIAKRAVYKELGMSEFQIRGARRKVKKGQYPSYEWMEKVLRKAGYEVVQERKWEKSN